MVGCTAKHQCHDILISPSCQRLPGEDVCLPCERGKVAGQAPGLRWWIWNHSSSGRMSWISGMIRWIKHDQAPNTIVVDRGCHTWKHDMLTSWRISWFLSQFPSSNGDFKPPASCFTHFYHLLFTYYSPMIPPVFRAKRMACVLALHAHWASAWAAFIRFIQASQSWWWFVLPGQFHVFHYLPSGKLT